jgi:hypothetical protein
VCVPPQFAAVLRLLSLTLVSGEGRKFIPDVLEIHARVKALDFKAALDYIDLVNRPDGILATLNAHPDSDGKFETKYCELVAKTITLTGGSDAAVCKQVQT